MILARHLSYVESFIYYFGAALFGVQELVSLWKAEVLSKEDGARVGFGVDPSLPPDHGLDPSLPPDQDLVASVENKSQVLFTVADPMNMLGVEEDNYFEGNAEELSPVSYFLSLSFTNSPSFTPSLTFVHSHPAQVILPWPTSWTPKNFTSWQTWLCGLAHKRRSGSQLLQHHATTSRTTMMTSQLTHNLPKASPIPMPQ